MKISIITTVKNGARYIFETLESIKNQRFKDFEHIIIDDGSTDDTVTIIKDYQEKNPEYKLKLYQPGNLGRGKALNYAISKSSNEWIAIIDADDLWHPQKLEIQYKIVQENNIDVLATQTTLFSDSRDLEFSETAKQEIYYFRVSDLLWSNKISHSSVLIKKAICNYDENRKSQFDYQLWMRLISKNYNLAVVKTILSYHRLHENQSFEGKMGYKYRLRSFKINAHYIIKNYRFDILLVKFIKLIVTLIIPRKYIHKTLKK